MRSGSKVSGKELLQSPERHGPTRPDGGPPSWASAKHPGVLAAKVSDFGSNLLKCPRVQMGTKPAKVGHLAPGAI